MALLIDNTGNPLASVQVQTSSGWLSLARASYNYWIAQSGAGPGPFTVRLTDTQGHQATVSGITLSPGVAQPTGTWMYGGSGGAAQAPATRAAIAAPPARATAAATTGAAEAATARPVVARAAPLTPGAPASQVTAGAARPARLAPAPSARSSC